MNKIKINKQVEEEIGVVSMICLLKGHTAHEFLDEFVKLYKKSDGINMFKTEETDAIMQSLKSMPGYTPEKLLAAGAPMTRDISNPHECFEWQLYNVYIMLSITNPEFFEDYKEAEDGKINTKD